MGFRPYVYRLAMRHGLGGFVANNSNGAEIEIEGAAPIVERFQHDLLSELPPLAQVTELCQAELPSTGVAEFRIHHSQRDPRQRPEVTPDAATCADCLRELHDPNDRRYRYAFTNCTNCGPRYTIIHSTPYDRPLTTMAAFEMCPQCAAEYADPASRRFHAQPNACPDCGPQLELLTVIDQAADPPQTQRCSGDPIEQAATMLRDGKILAVKGLGGFHLACRADDETVVQRLRQRKLRDGKPLALMVPTSTRPAGWAD